MSTTKRKKDKKPRPKLRPISSPDHLSNSSTHDELFGFSDVILTREPKIGSGVDREDVAAGQRNDVEDLWEVRGGDDVQEKVASSWEGEHSSLEAVASVTADAQDSSKTMESKIVTTLAGGADKEEADVIGASLQGLKDQPASEGKRPDSKVAIGVDETFGAHRQKEDEASSSFTPATTIPTSCNPVQVDKKVSSVTASTWTCGGDETSNAAVEKEDYAASSFKTATTVPTSCDPGDGADSSLTAATIQPESGVLSTDSKPTSGKDESVGLHPENEVEAKSSFKTNPRSPDLAKKEEAVSNWNASTIHPESVVKSFDSISTCSVQESVGGHRENEYEAVSSVKTAIKSISCDEMRKGETGSGLKGEISQPQLMAESTDREVCNSDTKLDATVPTSKGGTVPSTLSALLSSSPVSETGANYAAQYICEETPDTTKTRTTTETDSITQHEEEDADGSLESIQQPEFDNDKKSTPTKSEVVNDVKESEIMTTSTPVFSNVTITSNAATLKIKDSNIKAEDDIAPQTKRTKRRSSKRLQPRSSLFSPEDRVGPNPKTPDADGYDIFGFDLVRSESERGSAEELIRQQSDQDGVSSVEGSSEILQPVNLETSYTAGAAENLGTDLHMVGETSTVDVKREEIPGKSSSVEGTSEKSYSRGASSVSFGSLNASFESEKTEIVHLLGSKSDLHQEGSRRDSSSDSDSSFTSSDGETSYFSESRASTEDRNRPQCSTHSSKPSPKMPPSYPPNLPMRSQVHPQSASFRTRSAIEMRLSLSVSEEDAEEAGVLLQNELDAQDDHHEELVLYQTFNPTRGDSFGSSLVESASSDSENENVPLHQLESNPEEGKESDRRHASSTPFSNTSTSTDDAGVVNELNTYLMSSNNDDDDIQIDTPPSGRLSPVGGGHLQSALDRKSNKYSDTPTPTNAEGARYIYADIQSAVVAANANAGARKPTSSLDTPSMSSSSLQYNIKEAPKPTQVHSPGGAFNTTSSKSSPFTPKEKIQSLTGLHSLAYSEDDNIDYSDKTPPTFRQIKNEFDEEMAELLPISELKTQVSSSRWSLLFCVSILNLLAGWTCFSVAPISSTSEALGDVQPEYLVSIFLLAHCIACVFEPAILGRLGFRKTIVFGALLLMLGSLVKSGGAPLLDFIGEDRGWRIYLGFFSVGFSHPFYQCTISILANAWFPENERRIASDIALNCYQIGITLSFVFGTFLVKSADDVSSYFQLLSLISVGAFCLASFMVDDAPPNPPSGALEASVTKRQKRLKMEQRKQRRKRNLTPKTNKKNKIDNVPTPEHCESNLSKEIICLDQNLGRVTDVKQEEQSLLLTQPLPRSPSPTMSGIIPGRTYGSTENTESAVSSNSSPHDFDGVEPVIFQTPHNLDIDVRGDQVWILMKACGSFKGFSHCLLAYMASGIVINTLNTFISDLVQLNGAPKMYVGIVGGGFQLLTVMSALIFGKRASKSRKIYRSILILLVLGAVALTMCSLQLVGSSNVGNLNLSVWILVVAFLVGPLPFLSTNLGSRVGRPLSENGVLLIQRLFSNLVSAACIPAFSILRHYSLSKDPESSDFALSIFLLVLFTVISAIYFAFFSSPSLLYEDESYVCGSGTCPKNPNSMLILPYRKFVQPPYQPWVPPGRRKGSDKYPFLIPS